MRTFLLFLEGISAFVSPCLLPMLPLYLSYFSAGEENRRKTFANALGFVSGFSLVFVLLGALAGSLGGLLQRYAAQVNLVTGIVVIVLGLNFLGVLKIPVLNQNHALRFDASKLGVFRSLLFGIVFSIGWTPCVGAFLGSALMVASAEGGLLRGSAMLLVFSLGLAVPFLLSALLLDRLKGSFAWIKRNYKIVNAVSGGLLLVMGVFMASGQLTRVLRWLSF